jgi:3-oxoadipate CoA-transferase beta subunit
MMNLFTRDGTSKLVAACTYPLTGVRCVSRVYTDHAVFLLDRAGGVTVRELFGITFAELQRRVPVPLTDGAS